MIILRCFGAENYYLERVIFPFEILNFTAPQEAEVEIWSHELAEQNWWKVLRLRNYTLKKRSITALLKSAVGPLATMPPFCIA